MDRNAVLRWTLIALAIIVFWKWGMPAMSGKSDAGQHIPLEAYVDAPGFPPDIVDPGATEAPPDGASCTLQGNRFSAVLSARGAAVKHFFLQDPQYAGSQAADLSTTPDVERWRSLRTTFRGKDASDQVAFDRFLWKVAVHDGRTCSFTYEDDSVRLEKAFTGGGRAFELEVTTKVTNKTDAAKRHQLRIGAYAFRRNQEVKGNLGRVSPFVTELQCAKAEKVERKAKDDFKEGWTTVPGAERYGAVTNYYFAQALVPTDGQVPDCNILAEEWYSAAQAKDDDDAGHVYHAVLAYPARQLGPNESATYAQIAFFGPKDRAVLKAAAGGTHGLGDLINLGFFSPVAKILVSTLHFIREHVTFGNWGVAIIVMTLALRVLLFPLTWKSIQTTIAMRRLKPEMDALNARFPDDPQSKNLAMMELYRKQGVNPFGGCLPQLVQMPIWFAMYTTLQTAVELYHVKFLWFADLSAPDRFYILPLVLGGFMIIQQRIVPQQGMDPMQQKMMTWMMPAIFTVMMLFLAAALGVYMLTNSVLGIVQQLAVEKLAPRGGQPPSRSTGNGKGDIVVKEVPTAKVGKGEARV